VPLAPIWGARRDIILSAAQNFHPDALIVDHTPAGLKGEVVPTLRAFAEESPRRTRLVLGLRDILDEAPRVRESWSRDQVYGLLDRYYDLILVYGQRDVYDVVTEYRLSPRAAAKTRYVGYLRREPGARPPEDIRRELGLRTDRLVVVTAGGGGDGYELMRTVLEGLRGMAQAPRFDCLLIGGPLMDPDEREIVVSIVRTLPNAQFLEFTRDMASYLAAADVVVSMGGYNAVCEALSAERPTIIVPRVQPRQEQLLRAQALQRRGVARMLHPDELSADRLVDEVTSLLDHPQGPGALVDMNGLPGVAAEVDAILAQLPGLGRELVGPDRTLTRRAF
jgi:predicted glycosyltransferase